MTNLILQHAQSTNKLDSILKQKDRDGFTPMDLLSNELDPARLIYHPISIGSTESTSGSSRNLKRYNNKSPSKIQHRNINISKDSRYVPRFDSLCQWSQESLSKIMIPTESEDLLTSLSNPAVISVKITRKHIIILTDTDHGNIFVSGSGSNGRLGLGTTKPSQEFTPIPYFENDKITMLEASQDYSVVINESNDIFSFGSNQFGCLGVLDSPLEALSPRRLSLPTKKWKGLAASKLHCCCYTTNEIWFWGLNVGQMGFKSSGEVVFYDKIQGYKQAQPLKLEFLYDDIQQVICNDFTTLILTVQGDIHIYTNGFHTKFTPPMFNKNWSNLDAFKPRIYTTKLKIVKLTFRGEFVLILFDNGDIIQFLLKNSFTTAQDLLKSLKTTTVWKLTKGHLKCTDFDISEDGSVIICVQDGSVYRRVKRQQQKLKKLFKFTKIFGINNVVKVFSNFDFKKFIFIKQKIPELPLKLSQSSFYSNLSKLSILNDDQKTTTKKTFETNQPELYFDLDHDITDLKIKLMTPNWVENRINTYPSLPLCFISREGHRIPIHKSILILRSKKFANFLNSGDLNYKNFYLIRKTNEIETNFNLRSICVVLHYLYTGEFITWTGLNLSREISTVKDELNLLFEMLDIYPVNKLFNFTNILDDLDCCDTVIKLSHDEQVNCFSEILKIQSDFFSTVFKWKSPLDYEIDLRDVDLKSFKIVLEYLHGVNCFQIFDDLKFDSQDDFLNFVIECIELSDNLLLFELKSFLEHYIIKFIDLENCIILLRHSFDLNCNAVLEYCLWFIYNNLSYYLFDQEFNELINLNNFNFLKKINQSFKYFNNFKKVESSEFNYLDKNSEFLLRLFLNDISLFNDYFNTKFEPLFDLSPGKSKENASKLVKLEKSDSDKMESLTPERKTPERKASETKVKFDDSAIADDDEEASFIEVTRRRRSSARKPSMNDSKSRANSITDSRPESRMSNDMRSESRPSIDMRPESRASVRVQEPKSRTASIESRPDIRKQLQEFTFNDTASSSSSTASPKIKKIIVKKPTQRERKKSLFESTPMNNVSSSSSSIPSRSNTPVWNSTVNSSRLPSLSEIISQEEDRLKVVNKPVKSLDEIQKEEEFENWFLEESQRYQQQLQQQQQQLTRHKKNRTTRMNKKKS